MDRNMTCGSGLSRHERRHQGRLVCAVVVLVICQLSPGSLPAQVAESIDTIPRDRLVTDQELFEHLDGSISGLQKTFSAAAAGDTARALGELADYMSQRKTPRYFFDPNQVRDRVQFFSSTYPKTTDQIATRTAEFMAAYGENPDWMIPGKDLLGRPHTANTIRFLARQALATDIAFMYHKTGGKRFINFQMNQVKDFIQDYESGRTEAGANDVFERYYAGHRTRNWLFAHQLLLGSPDYEQEDQALMLKVFLLHGARLYDSCKKFHWGNHQLHGLEGLFEISLMFPEFRVMGLWHKRAVELIMEHLEKEIKPDGFQFERASHYFKLDILNYFRVYQLAKVNQLTMPPLLNERFRKMFDALVALAKPDRALPALQDAQGVYLPHFLAQKQDNRPDGEVESNDVAELPDLKESLFMSLGAVLYNNSTYKFFGAEQFPAKLYWFLDANAGERYQALAMKSPTIGSVALHASNYYVMRSGWSQDDLYMIVDGGLAQYKPDHTHGGVLGVIAHAFGQDILPNYRVRYSEPAYRTLKNSQVKNVALADNQLQGRDWQDNKAQTGFGLWRQLPTPTVLEWLSAETIDFFSGSHDGFVGNGVNYTRNIFFLKPYGWVITDAFEGQRAHSFQQIWQGRFVEGTAPNSVVSEGLHSRLMIQQADPSMMEITHRDNFGKKSVQFEKKGIDAYTFTTLVLPTRQSDEGIQIKRFDRPEFNQISVIGKENRDLLFFRGDRDLKRALLESDAQFVFLRFEQDILKAVLLHEGTRLHTKELSLEAQSVASVEVLRQPTGEWKANILRGENAQIKLIPHRQEITNRSGYIHDQRSSIH